MKLEEMRRRKDEIIANTNMFDLLKQYGIPVKGRACCCPFHADRHPSAKVFDDGIQCRVCLKNYNVFDLTMQVYQCGFYEAFTLLGGNEKPTWEQYATADRLRKRRQEAEMMRKYKSDKLAAISTEIMILKSAIRDSDPLGDIWSWAVSKLVYNEYLFDAIYDEVYSK